MTGNSPTILAAEAAGHGGTYGPQLPAIEDVDAARGEVFKAIADFSQTPEDIGRAEAAAQATLLAYGKNGYFQPQLETEPEAPA
jgi:hypothetical protein